jgi:hypothetical protein
MDASSRMRASESIAGQNSAHQAVGGAGKSPQSGLNPCLGVCRQAKSKTAASVIVSGGSRCMQKKTPAGELPGQVASSSGRLGAGGQERLSVGAGADATKNPHDSKAAYRGSRKQVPSVAGGEL